MRTYSPLRYPGGKGQIYNRVLSMLERNDLIGCTYIEPFAGGAGIAIRLLFENKVQSIIINDVDKSIYSLWYSILYYTDELCELIENTVVNMSEWEKQKNIQKNKDNSSILDLGFSTFFLNRTNRSGIIKAGVIGGKNQNGNYKLDCRFNKKKLIELIKNIANYKERILIYNDDAKLFIEKVKYIDNQFYFIDPPYFEKGKNLYTNFFNEKDHEILAKYIKDNLSNKSLLISYDNCPQIQKLYSNYKAELMLLNYSVQNKKKGEELFFTNNII